MAKPSYLNSRINCQLKRTRNSIDFLIQKLAEFNINKGKKGNRIALQLQPTIRGHKHKRKKRQICWEFLLRENPFSTSY